LVEPQTHGTQNYEVVAKTSYNSTGDGYCL